MLKKKNKAQVFTGYAFLIVLAVAALVAMRVFMVRVVQEKFRQSADVFGQGEQYERGITEILVNR